MWGLRGILLRKPGSHPSFSVTLLGVKCMCFGESINSAHSFSEEETGMKHGLNLVLMLILYRVEKAV